MGNLFLFEPKSETSYLKKAWRIFQPKFNPSLQVEDKNYDMFEVSPKYDHRHNYGPIVHWRLKLKEFDVVLPPAFIDPQLTEHFCSVL